VDAKVSLERFFETVSSLPVERYAIELILSD
jgi:hypothetical protein